MTLPQRLPRLTLLALLAPATVAAAQSAVRPPKAESKPYSITVQSTVPGLAIMEDGFFLGHAGSPIDSTLGIHELSVSAPGYVPRLLRVQINGKSLDTQVAVGLLPVPEKNTTVELDFSRAAEFQAAKTPEALPSLCEQVKTAGTALPRTGLLPCTRRSVLDDLKDEGYAPLLPQAVAVARYGQLVTAIDRADTDDYYWAAEAFYRQNPSDAAGAALLAFSAARRRACSRVMQISMEAGAGRLQAPGLTFVRGLCLELSGARDKAEALYQVLAKGDQGSVPGLAYHAARAAGRDTSLAAEALLGTCMQAMPYSYPCFEAEAQVLTLRQQAAKAQQVMTGYWVATGKAVDEALQSSGRDFDAPKVAAAQSLRPWSFELTAARILTTNDQALKARLQAAADNSLISSARAVKLLLPRLEEAGQGKLASTALKALVQWYPNQPTYLIKLAGHDRNQGRCAESLALADRALKLLKHPDRRAALIISMTTCRLALDQAAEAEKQLTAVCDSYPENWKAVYNLGVVQERLGKTQLAMRSFQQALLGDVPPKLRARLEQALAFYASKNPEPAAPAEPEAAH